MMTSMDGLGTPSKTKSMFSANGRPSFNLKSSCYTMAKQLKRESLLAKLDDINPSHVIDKLKNEKRLLDRDNVDLERKLE